HEQASAYPRCPFASSGNESSSRTQGRYRSFHGLRRGENVMGIETEHGIDRGRGECYLFSIRLDQRNVPPRMPQDFRLRPRQHVGAEINPKDASRRPGVLFKQRKTEARPTAQIKDRLSYRQRKVGYCLHTQLLTWAIQQIIAMNVAAIFPSNLV